MGSSLHRLFVVSSLALATLSFDMASAASPEPVTKDFSGEAVQARLQQRFDEKPYDCGDDANGHPHPAFLCSGILMRATEYSKSYRSWLPNPATASWGVSFSWLRQDSNFPENYPSGNGYIVYPWFKTPRKGYEQLMVRCIYPQDAWTGAPDRCVTDRSKQAPRLPTQKVCQDQGVYSDKTWLNDKRFGADGKQCAFGVEDGRQTNTAEAWMQVVDIRRTRKWFVRNEVIVAAWPQDVGPRMPVEAFFYRNNCFVTDKDCGDTKDSAKLSAKIAIPARRLDAQSDQKDFLAVTGRWVPVILWTPATSIGGRATFKYSAKDQGVPEPAR